MKKLGLILAAAMIFSACGEAPKSDATTENTKPVVKIGINLPMTGGMGFAGENMQKALTMALRDMQQQSLKYDYKLVIEDNSFNNRKTSLNLTKFKSIDKVNALMSLFGSSAILTSDFAEKNKIVHMSCAWSDEVGKGYYNFNHDTKPMTMAKKVVDYYRQNNYKRVAFLYHSLLEVEEFFGWFTPLLKQDGFDVVAEIPYIEPQKDFRTDIEKLRQANPDIIYIMATPPELGIIAKQVKEQHLNVPLTSFNTFGFYPDGYEGAKYFTESTGTNDFYNSFKQYSGLNPMPCTANMYDGLRMLIHAFEKTGDGNTIPTSEQVVEALHQSHDFKSVFEQIEMDKEGNIDIPTVIKQIINGQPVLVEE